MRNDLPGVTMIAVEQSELDRLRKIAECFKDGDAAALELVIYEHRETAKFLAGFGKIKPEYADIIDMLERHKAAAELAEDSCK